MSVWLKQLLCRLDNSVAATEIVLEIQIYHHKHPSRVRPSISSNSLFKGLLFVHLIYNSGFNNSRFLYFVAFTILLCNNTWQRRIIYVLSYCAVPTRRTYTSLCSLPNFNVTFDYKLWTSPYEILCSHAWAQIILPGYVYCKTHRLRMTVERDSICDV